jgi:hypothetical protein
MKYGLLIITFSILLTGACRKDPYRGNVSGTDLPVSINRLEMDLFALDPDSITMKVPVLYEKYGDFFDLFNYQIGRASCRERV